MIWVGEHGRNTVLDSVWSPKREIHIRDGSDDELRVISVRHLYHCVGIPPQFIIDFNLDSGIRAKHEVLRGYGGLMGVTIPFDFPCATPCASRQR